VSPGLGDFQDLYSLRPKIFTSPRIIFERPPTGGKTQ
jgi:hypothetical protein